MTDGLRRRTWCGLGVLGLFLLVSAGALAQSAAPDNSQKGRYGDGWTCIPGYQELNLHCVKLVVPANAYRDGSAYGREWSYLRGLLTVGDGCVRIRISENVYLDSSGYG